MGCILGSVDAAASTRSGRRNVQSAMARGQMGPGTAQSPGPKTPINGSPTIRRTGMRGVLPVAPQPNLRGNPAFHPSRKLPSKKLAKAKLARPRKGKEQGKGRLRTRSPPSRKMLRRSRLGRPWTRQHSHPRPPSRRIPLLQLDTQA